jgi:hypothetical protein
MILQHPRILGFSQYLSFPLLGLFIPLAGYVSGSPVPVSVFAGLYPISLILLTIYCPIISKRVFPSPSLAIVRFARGSYDASIGLTVAAVALSAVVLIGYHQLLSGFGVLLAGVGSLWLPTVWAGAGYGKILADSGEGSRDFLEELRLGRMFATAGATWLGTFIQPAKLLETSRRQILFVMSSVILSPLGWLMTGLGDGFTYSIIAIFVLLVYLLAASVATRIWVPREKRGHVSQSIMDSSSRL